MNFALHLQVSVVIRNSFSYGHHLVTVIQYLIIDLLFSEVEFGLRLRKVNIT